MCVCRPEVRTPYCNNCWQAHEWEIRDQAAYQTARADYDVKKAMEVLTAAMKSDPALAHGWHCNVAMMCYDAIMSPYVHKVAHAVGNDAASRFMKLAFDVETSNDMLTNGVKEDGTITDEAERGHGDSESD